MSGPRPIDGYNFNFVEVKTDNFSSIRNFFCLWFQKKKSDNNVQTSSVTVPPGRRYWLHIGTVPQQFINVGSRRVLRPGLHWLRRLPTISIYHRFEQLRFKGRARSSSPGAGTGSSSYLLQTKYKLGRPSQKDHFQPLQKAISITWYHSNLPTEHIFTIPPGIWWVDNLECCSLWNVIAQLVHVTSCQIVGFCNRILTSKNGVSIYLVYF